MSAALFAAGSLSLLLITTAVDAEILLDPGHLGARFDGVGGVSG